MIEKRLRKQRGVALAAWLADKTAEKFAAYEATHAAWVAHVEATIGWAPVKTRSEYAGNGRRRWR
jgi:hypothetical protein